MILMIIAAFGVLVVAAVVVGVIDALHAASWREIAAVRRRHWESLHLQPQGARSTDEFDDD